MVYIKKTKTKTKKQERSLKKKKITPKKEACRS